MSVVESNRRIKPILIQDISNPSANGFKSIRQPRKTGTEPLNAYLIDPRYLSKPADQLLVEDILRDTPVKRFVRSAAKVPSMALGFIIAGVVEGVTGLLKVITFVPQIPSKLTAPFSKKKQGQGLQIGGSGDNSSIGIKVRRDAALAAPALFVLLMASIYMLFNVPGFGFPRNNFFAGLTPSPKITQTTETPTTPVSTNNNSSSANSTTKSTSTSSETSTPSQATPSTASTQTATQSTDSSIVGGRGGGPVSDTASSTPVSSTPATSSNQGTTSSTSTPVSVDGKPVLGTTDITLTLN